MDALAQTLLRADTPEEVGAAVAAAVEQRIGMSAFSMLRCAGAAVTPSDMFALNSRVSPTQVQATIPDILPVIERELEPFASVAQKHDKSFDVAERFPHDVVRRSEVYNTVWRPFGVERQLVGYLTARRQFAGFICVARSSREPAFTRSDLGALESIRATVEQALTATRQLGIGKLEDSLAVLAEASVEAWFLFDAAGQLLWMTDEARARLSLDAMRVGSSMVLRHSAALEELRAWVRLRARGGDGAPAVSPLACSTTLRGEEFVLRQFATRPGERLFLVGFADSTPPRRGVPADGRAGQEDAARRAAHLSRRFALTPRQTEVLAELAWGKANKTIAANLGCAESTVELHVTALLVKLGCESRAEAVARFWTAH